jgi:hypothetical protein
MNLRSARVELVRLAEKPRLNVLFTDLFREKNIILIKKKVEKYEL